MASPAFTSVAARDVAIDAWWQPPMIVTPLMAAEATCCVMVDATAPPQDPAPAADADADAGAGAVVAATGAVVATSGCADAPVGGLALAPPQPANARAPVSVSARAALRGSAPRARFLGESTGRSLLP